MIDLSQINIHVVQNSMKSEDYAVLSRDVKSGLRDIKISIFHPYRCDF